ncbi:MAG: hypothetical protein QOE01_1815 [Actinomycetota bacterium]|jgi:hypothetical protein|nr:hypothetical protein [Actinomycetota bacterium]
MSDGNGSADLDRDELRAVVRAVLRDVLPALKDGTPGGLPTRSETVRIGTDADLVDLVARVLTLAEDPDMRADLLAGRHRFVLAEATGAEGALPGVTPAPPVVPAHRVDRGAVTERRVAAAAADGARLVVGRRAVMTPLARDKARALGVVVEKEH